MTDPSPRPSDPARTRDKFTEGGLERVKDDPYAELFADCRTAEEVVALQQEIYAADD